MISPIMSNGIVAQTQNVSAIQHGDENRTQLNYQQTSATVENQRETAHNTVIASQDSSKTGTQHDAKEEGKNKYFDNRNKNKKKPQDSDGQVVIKKTPGGFDMSV